MDANPNPRFDLARALQVAVLRPQSKYVFFADHLPDWWSADIGVSSERGIELKMPALREFIDDVRAIWNPGASEVVASPIFQANSSQGEQVELQAIAVQQAEESVLVVRNLHAMDEWLVAAIRTARRNMLQKSKDSSRHKQEVAEIIADRDEAQLKERIKSEFLANMSHEIRTPLTTILGMAALAKKDGHGANQYLDSIVDAGNRLLRLANDILDVSRIQANRLELVSAPFSLREMLKDAETEWQLLAKNASLQITIHTSEDTPDRVLGDAFRLRQVLTNLVGNATKFTKDGGIQVQVEPDAVRTDHVLFSISDTGIGISKAQQEHIFETFTQVDQSVQRQQRGAGLGLAIASSIVELMEGKLRVTSELGRGSCFYFNAHLPKTGPLPEASLDPGCRSGNVRKHVPIRILLAEDHDVNRSIIVDTLTSVGVDIVEVEDGRAAVEAWENQAFDLVLMDCQMPVMNGFDAIARIRKQESGGRRTPIIALTAHAMKHDRQRLTEVGADYFLAKPFQREHLIQLVFDVANADN